ncbi:MAG TPA: isoprenylcysteine carboxylmethyltransferase family protein [Gaiellaceae bacterium]|nr:isoprenylcysteine carboxylmethyltransferase family protein [Gaiellaceae bacterium]
MAVIATAICWGLVLVTWIAGAAYGARGPHGRRQGYGSGAIWRIGAVIALVLVSRLGRHELHRVTDHALWIEIPGLVLLVASTAFTVWARVKLGRMWSASPDVLQAPHELRTDGPYAVTRHPIYTGLFGMLVGTVLLNGLGTTLAFLVVGAAVVATRIPIEERLMSKTFPEEYARYRERVPRFVPGQQLLRRSHRTT